jgi:protoheme IX farnesyltransferase
MERTADRPVASGRVSPRAALSFGLILGAASLVWLTLLVNPLAAALSFAGFIGYAVGYTMLLKRHISSVRVGIGSEAKRA